MCSYSFHYHKRTARRFLMPTNQNCFYVCRRRWRGLDGMLRVVYVFIFWDDLKERENLHQSLWKWLLRQNNYPLKINNLIHLYVVECLENEFPSNILFKIHLLPKTNLRVVSHFEKCYFIGHNFSWFWWGLGDSPTQQMSFTLPSFLSL